MLVCSYSPSIFNLVVGRRRNTRCQRGRWSSATDERGHSCSPVLPCSCSVGSLGAVQGMFSHDGARHKAVLGLYRVLLSRCTSFSLLHLPNSHHCPAGSYLELSCPAHWPRLSPHSPAFPRWAFCGWVIRNALALASKLSLDEKLPTNTSREWNDIKSENLLQKDA